MQSGCSPPTSQWYFPARQTLPTDLVLEVAQYLGLMDVVSRLGAVCREWRRVVLRFEGSCHWYFSCFSSARFAVEDVVTLLKIGEKRYKPVLEKLDLSTIAAVKRFCKVTRFHLELASPDIPAYRVLRLKHISRHGELCIPPSALTALCLSSCTVLQELQLQNCHWDFPLIAAVAACTSLHTLNLSYSGASDAVLEALSRSKAAIKRLVLKGLDRITSKSIELVGDMREISELDLSYSFSDLCLPSLHPLSALPLTHLLLGGYFV